ncbi:Vacuolar protein sorting-associated protein 51 [Araneus ventricosus]|uniref:Vacuolar protein sorting-associated protein 51 homolog n=1 Tax=Araneus ventricosus TaxID=182803 RepID=A0A4Y2GPQ2_ARAVE|nr:Vacuolar protein sorting-associated protein 51 [Araneus ventricosus]
MTDKFDPYDMDREEFNPDLCMLRFAEDCSLQQILSRRNHLDMEIKGIAAGIQNMLYDNYTKFITASEVISKIKNDFEKMDDDIRSLGAKMNSIENLSSQIVENLQPTKDKRQRLIKSKESVAKLALLVNLIPKLREYTEQGYFIAAAKHYLKAKHLLTQHQNSNCLKEIIEESKDITSYVREKLRNKLDCCVYSKEEISETMNLILDLGETESEILRNFLLISKDNLDGVMQKIGKNCFSGVNGDDRMVTAVSCSEHSCAYLDMLSKVVEIVQGVFSAKPTTLQWSSILVDFVEDNSQQLYLLAGSAFKNQFGNLNDECLANSLDHLYRKSYECNSRMPKIATSEKSADVILHVCSDRCAYHLRRMKQDFQAYLLCLEERLNGEHKPDELLTWMNTLVHDIFTNTLHSLCHFISPEHKYSRNAYFRKSFCKLLAREEVFIPFLRDINGDILKAIYALRGNEAVALKMCMLFTKYVLQLHQSKVRNFLNLVDERLHSSTENVKLTSASEIGNKCKETAERIINCYIETRQRRMSDMFRHSMENKNWMMAKEPWKVSAVVRRVLEDFYATVKETEALVECAKSPTRDRSCDSGKSACLSSLSRTSSPDNGAVDDRMTIRIHKLFSKPSSTSEAVEFSSDYVLNRIVKMTLKSLLEYIRQSTFNRFGLQQIQVDVHCLELHVAQYVGNGRDMDALFDDMISSCYGRTIHPEFMNPHVVSSLCQALSF